MEIKLPIMALTCFLLISCSDKEHLSGERENISFSDDGASTYLEIDKTPVVIDAEKRNAEFLQPFMNHTHCYAPFELSSSPMLRLWTSTLDYGCTNTTKAIAAPLVADGKVFCMDAGGIVYALNKQTGARIWRMSTTLVRKDGQIGGAIAYDRGRLIVSSSFAECFSLDANTGKILWRIKLPAPSKGDGITIYDGKAYVMCSNSTLQVIDIDNGKILWSHSGASTDTFFMGSASVAIENDIVFVAYPSGEIYALLLDTGAVLWDSLFSRTSLKDNASAFSHPRACPVVKDGIVYFVAANEQTAAFDTKTGKRLWISNFGGIQTPIVCGNSIFILNSQSELVCLNRFSGDLRWRHDISSHDKHDWYGLLLAGSNIVAISPDGRLRFVSAHNGKLTKTAKIEDVGDGISINPIIADSIMYLLTNDGRLLAHK
jgi:outer membrane protein assembly factor BamB